MQAGGSREWVQTLLKHTDIPARNKGAGLEVIMSTANIVLLF